MSSSTRRRRVDASSKSAPPAPTRFPASSKGITTATAKAKTKSVLSSLALAKTREYERRKQQLIAFTEKIMKKKIVDTAKKYIKNNLDTVYDFIAQLEHHPSIERAFPIEGLRKRRPGQATQIGLRVLIDVKLPKTALPDIDPIPPEVLSQSTPTTKRRIFVDIFHNLLYKVVDISAPQDPYFGAAAEYYSTFTDAHLGVRSADTGLESIPIIQSGLKDDVLLAILENLNGKNYCAIPVFKRVCEKIRGNINQTSRELTPFVSFPERSDSPDPENPHPMRDGIVNNSIDMFEFLPILLSNFYTYLDPKTRSGVDTTDKVTKMRQMIRYLGNLLKSAPRADENRGPPYYKNKVLKATVKLKDLMWLVGEINSGMGATIFQDFCTFAPMETSRGFKLYLEQNITATSSNFDDPLDLSSLVKTLLGAILGRHMVRFTNLELRVIKSRPELRPLLTVHLTYSLAPQVARPIEIPSSSVLNIPPSDLSRIPSSERVVSAELAGKKKSRRNKYKKRKTSKN